MAFFSVASWWANLCSCVYWMLWRHMILTSSWGRIIADNTRSLICTNAWLLWGCLHTVKKHRPLMRLSGWGEHMPRGHGKIWPHRVEGVLTGAPERTNYRGHGKVIGNWRSKRFLRYARFSWLHALAIDELPRKFYTGSTKVTPKRTLYLKLCHQNTCEFGMPIINIFFYE